MILQDCRDEGKSGISAVILSPTRELTVQIGKHMRVLAKGTHMKIRLLSHKREKGQLGDEGEDDDAEDEEDEEGGQIEHSNMKPAHTC